MSKFNIAYAEPTRDLDGGALAVSAELYTAEEAAKLFSNDTGETITPDMLRIEWAHWHGEYYDGEFINTWWRHSQNNGGDTPLVDQYEGKRGARKLWVY